MLGAYQVHVLIGRDAEECRGSNSFSNSDESGYYLEKDQEWCQE